MGAMPEPVIYLYAQPGTIAVIDEADYPLVLGRKWYANQHGGRTYFYARVAGGPRNAVRMEYLLRMVAGVQGKTRGGLSFR